MKFVELTRTNGKKWQVVAPNICGLSEDEVKGEMITSVIMAGNVTLQVQERPETIRKMMGVAFGTPVDVITRNHI